MTWVRQWCGQIGGDEISVEPFLRSILGPGYELLVNGRVTGCVRFSNWRQSSICGTLYKRYIISGEVSPSFWSIQHQHAVVWYTFVFFLAQTVDGLARLSVESASRWTPVWWTVSVGLGRLNTVEFTKFLFAFATFPSTVCTKNRNGQQGVTYMACEGVWQSITSLFASYR